MEFLPDLSDSLSPLMAFGLILVFGSLGGYFAHRLSWLPSITGFMAVGFLCGPSCLNFFSDQTLLNSQILTDIALALILYRLGLSLNIKLIWQSPGLLVTSLLESSVTFLLSILILIQFDIPLLIAAVIGSIAISSSPAVLLHVANEVGAEGDVTESTKTLVSLNNVISFLTFSTILPLLYYSSGANISSIILRPLYLLIGSFVLGGLLGYILHMIVLKTHKASQYRLALVIGVVMFALGLATELKLSILFIPLVIGIVVKSMEKKVVISDLEFGPAFELFFVTLFVIAGANLHIDDLLKFMPAVLALVFVRSIAKFFSISITFSLYKKPLRQGIASGLLVIPMAGLAIGLVNTSNLLFPEHSSYISAVVLGAVAIFESIGPPIASFAFTVARESSQFRKDEPEPQVSES